jgi:hypothetical protein
MQSHTPVNKFSILLGGLLSAVVLSTSAFAQHAGGGGGGHAGGGGGHAGGAHAAAGGHYAGGYGGRGGAYGGYRGGGYGGYRGGYGYGGWHGGYGYGWRGGWGCCGWGWGGLGLGLYFASLPFYYDTYYWGGVPYYYADNTYYIYDPNQKQYETVAPPQGVQDQAATGGGAAPADLIAYPKNGQSADQQAKDKFECHEWAAGQTGFDPTQGSAAPGNKRNDYMRAQAACLDGRGYSVN